MDMRILVIRTGGETILKVDGSLTAARLPILESAVATLGEPFAVDLSELRASDDEGIAALRTLREAGAELRGLSPLIALRLGVGDDDVEQS